MQLAGFSSQGPCLYHMKWVAERLCSLMSRRRLGTSPELLSMARSVLLPQALVEREEQARLLSAGNGTLPLTAHF